MLGGRGPTRRARGGGVRPPGPTCWPPWLPPSRDAPEPPPAPALATPDPRLPERARRQAQLRGPQIPSLGSPSSGSCPGTSGLRGVARLSAPQRGSSRPGPTGQLLVPLSGCREAQRPRKLGGDRLTSLALGQAPWASTSSLASLRPLPVPSPLSVGPLNVSRLGNCQKS